MRFNGDLVPIASGVGDIGQTEIPVIKVFQESGVFYGQGLSGIIRFDGAQERLQGSNDGGATFFNIPVATGGGVDSISVIGYANLTGDIDLSSPSGYVILSQAGQTINMDVDVVGLSGFWGLQSFDNVVTGFSKSGSTVLVDDVTISEGSFIDLTQAAQDVAIDVDTAALSGHYGLRNFDNMCRGYAETIGVAATTWNINHNLNTENIIAQAYDNTGDPLNILPDDIQIMDADNINVYFNRAQQGKIVVMGF